MFRNIRTYGYWLLDGICGATRVLIPLYYPLKVSGQRSEVELCPSRPMSRLEADHLTA